MAEGPRDRMVRHITFAERWLARAKAECADGRLARSGLTLMLAEAEVHHARESTATVLEAAPAVRRASVAPLVGAAGLAVAGLALLMMLLPGREPGIASTSPPGPAVIRLNHPIGHILALVPQRPQPTRVVVREPSARSAVAPGSARRTAAPVRPARTTSTSAGLSTARRNAAVSLSRPALRPATATRTSISFPAALTRPAVSQTDLIELVLAAERSLRTGTP